MVEGRETLLWDIGAIIWATLCNVNRDPKKTPKPFHPADVHPHRERDDYDDGIEKDADYHRERRLRMLPPEMQKRVREQWQKDESKPARHS